ncbi:MAG: hypothetical protein Q7R45_12960 [Sulfuricaulis sp.]|nr:hypothetical protein [Sulfuricaulis sp.]
MSDEFRLRKATERATQAQALADNPLLKEAFEVYERDMLKLWAETAVAATDERERIWLAIKVARMVRGHLFTVMSNGRLASAELTQMLGRKP